MEHIEFFKESPINQIFGIVMAVLFLIAKVTGFTYKFINIYVYFLLFPISLLFFFKNKIKYLFLFSSTLFFLTENSLSVYLFDKSVEFLNYTASIFNSNYTEMSVIICVIVPLLIYALMFLIVGKIKRSMYFILILSGLYAIYHLFLFDFFNNLISVLTHS